MFVCFKLETDTVKVRPKRPPVMFNPHVILQASENILFANRGVKRRVIERKHLEAFLKHQSSYSSQTGRSEGKRKE